MTAPRRARFAAGVRIPGDPGRAEAHETPFGKYLRLTGRVA